MISVLAIPINQDSIIDSLFDNESSSSSPSANAPDFYESLSDILSAMANTTAKQAKEYSCYDVAMILEKFDNVHRIYEAKTFYIVLKLIESLRNMCKPIYK